MNNYARSSLVNRYLYPTILFDLAFEHRDPDGQWNGEWLLEADRFSRSDFSAVAKQLERPCYFEHWVQLYLYCARSELDSDICAFLDDLRDGGWTPEKVEGFQYPRPWMESWASQIASISPKPQSPLSMDFLEIGPLKMKQCLGRLERVFRRADVFAVLSGSFAMFLQTPFRLSPDIDFSVDTRRCSVDHTRLATILAEEGFRVTKASPSYVGAKLSGSIPITIDIELGSAYTFPLEDFEGLRFCDHDAFAFPVMDIKSILEFKNKRGTFKDIVDQAFVKGIRM